MRLLLLLLLLPAPAAAQGLFEEALAGAEEAEQPAEQGAAGEDPGAAEASEPGGAPAGLSATVAGLGVSLGGSVRGVLYVGPKPDRRTAEVKSGYGEAALRLRLRRGRWGDAFAEARLRGGYLEGERGAAADLREAYLNLYLGPLDLRLGHQIIVWGRADAINPTNTLTPLDLRVRSPDEDDLRRANLALRAQLHLAPIRWEVVWVPLYAPSRFPEFSPQSPVPGVSVALGAEQNPDAAVENGALGTRLHLILPAVEGSISYTIGHAPFPGLTLQRLDLGPPPAVTIAFAAYRQQVVGADFSTALYGFGLRGEVAWRSPFGFEGGEEVPRPDLQWVIGLDRELFGQLRIILQYQGRLVLRWDETPGFGVEEDDPLRRLALAELARANQALHNQLEQHQHGLTLRLGWSLLHETLRLELLALANFSSEELLVRPKVSYALADALWLSAGGEIYLGAEESLFGQVEALQSAAYLEARAWF